MMFVSGQKYSLVTQHPISSVGVTQFTGGKADGVVRLLHMQCSSLTWSLVHAHIFEQPVPC